ncbi:LPS translocon maturation chaperone LptM [Acinetobacter shaoyimingii]|uniref:Lipoprotein n=1 Tax=Acinetobacter shaoyimingii TaxID=2715164 RepID=A0A6G8RX37_9GAMM|nr:hypothetical protein [Acinetobacter shaoyimingii]NHB57908.1 hypothetical protein [Acinetobacter shaoyimingii]QIO06506.1 hypothetical protein G8E00_11350 [Acinetobacter shaoyimingii]
MRTLMCGTSLLWVTMTLVGCGQTGDLMLPNDPKDNRKTQYMLYKDDAKVQKPVVKATQEQTDTQSVAPAVSETK